MNTNELRRVLSDEIYRLRSGKSKPQRANAISLAAGKIIASVRLDLEYCRLTGQRPSIPFIKALPAPKNGKR